MSPGKWLSITGMLVLALQVAPSPCLAQGLFEEALADGGDDETSKTDVTGDAGVSLDMNGYVRGTVFVGKVPDEAEAEVKAGYGEACLKLKALAGAWGDAFSEVRVRGGSLNDGTGAEVDLREAYVDLYLGPLDIRFGRQIVAWGRADALNPTDNVTPRDMAVRSSVEDDRRMGNMVLRAILNVDKVRIEGIWVPFFRATRMPDFSLPGPIELGESDYPDTNLSSGTGAFRLNVVAPEAEGSVSYLFGYSVLPGVGLLGMDSSGPQVGFMGYRHHVAGMDFAATLWDWLGLRGEAAYRHPVGGDRIYVPHPDLQWVIGLDHEFPRDVYVILQYHGRYVFGWDEPQHGLIAMDGPFPDVTSLSMGARQDMLAIVQDEIAWKNRVVAGQTKRHAHTLMGRVEWKLLYETLSLELMGMFNASTMEWMVRPKVTYAVNDALKVIVGGEVYGGPDETLHGLIEQTMSAGFMEVRASF